MYQRGQWLQAFSERFFSLFRFYVLDLRRGLFGSDNKGSLRIVPEAPDNRRNPIKLTW